jgi:class 3 adenylate cyclase
MDFTALGDAVNVGARLQAHTIANAPLPAIRDTRVAWFRDAW